MEELNSKVLISWKHYHSLYLAMILSVFGFDASNF